jgi:hypothetical protein
MESRDVIRPILVGLVGIGLIVLVIVLIVKSLAGSPSAPTSQIDLTKYADTPNASVTLLIDTPTGIDQDHRQVRIIVSGTQNEIDILQGYQGTVMDRQTYPNNSAAFSVFLQTLKLMNFSKGSVSSANYEGYCPGGERYLYTFNNGENNLFTYWSTSCGGQGTFEGDAPDVLTQFEQQIPQSDFNNLTDNIPLGD